MSDSTRIEGTLGLCHQCEHQWPRGEGGLTCPRCGSEFVEIVSRPPSPIIEEPSLAEPFPYPRTDPLHALHQHNPWQEEPPDPGEDDITTYEFSSGGARGRVSFTTRTYRGDNTGRNVMAVPTGPLFDPILNHLEQYPEDPFLPHLNLLAEHMGDLLTEVPGEQTGRNRGFPNDPMMPNIFGINPGPRGFAPPAFPDPHDPQPLGNINDLFSMIFNTMNQPQPGVRGPGLPRNPTNPNEPPNPLAMLYTLLNPANAQHGDTVFSQEAFDRVMTQLMEQNQGSTAPGPASETAIHALETKKVDKDMLGSDGTAECSICMENVELGENVTVLPCNHWFHGQCVTAWLTEHDTCPHCRKPITPSADAGPQPQRPDQSRRRSSRRSSSIPSLTSPIQRARSPRHLLPETTQMMNEARQRYYDLQPSRYLEHEERLEIERRRQRHSSHNDSRHPRRDSRSGQNSSGDGSGGSGVTGWIRNHLPFQ